MLRIFLGLVIVAVIAAVWSNLRYRAQIAGAKKLWAEVNASAAPSPAFNLDMISELPEIGQRYFRHAIAEGTVLSRVAELSMSGEFMLGEKGETKVFAMEARQILNAPTAFVWMPRLTAGAVVMTGADSFVNGRGATQFWLLGLIPLVQGVDTVDINRAAAARPAVETIWAPASLLPQNGARWEQIGTDQAAITFADDPFDVQLELTLDADGAVQEIWAMRWSNANPAKTFQMQPFGGYVQGEATFGGFTIPSHIEVGNNFGTDAYFPFFIATLNSMEYR